MGTHMLDEIGAQVALLHESFELTGAHFDDGKLTSDKKSVEEDERSDRAKFGQDHQRRIPILRDSFRHRCDREKD